MERGRRSGEREEWREGERSNKDINTFITLSSVCFSSF
jgi:hypothetical protein